MRVAQRVFSLVKGSEQLRRREAGAQGVYLVVGQRDQGSPDVAVVEHAEQLQAGLGGGGAVVGHAHDRLVGGQQALVGLEGGGGVAVEEVLDHRTDRAAGGVAHDADH